MSTKPTKQKSQNDDPKNEADPHEEESDSESLLALIPEFTQTWFTSLIIHTALLVILAIITLAQIEDETINLAMTEATPSDAFIETPLDLDELEEPVEEMESELEEMTESFEDVMMESEVTVESLDTSALLSESDFGDFSAAEDMGEALGLGEESLSEMKSASTFFKTGNKAKKIVYVVDNSNSMGGGRMETALVELAKSVNSLDSSQQFYIVFYSDTAYGLFHPQTRKNYVRATYENKKLVTQWLETIQLCLKTNGTKAFEVARVLEPDLIYVLGDGGFTDGAHQAMIQNPIEGAIVNTLGMNMKGQNAERFKDIAKANGGTYRDVGITKEGLKILNMLGPRPKNNKRGRIWGVTLPLMKKNKN